MMGQPLKPALNSSSGRETYTRNVSRGCTLLCRTVRLLTFLELLGAEYVGADVGCDVVAICGFVGAEVLFFAGQHVEHLE
jgi:hypothetical protein